MKVLVTGVTGAVGPHVIAELQERHDLTLFARRPIEGRHPVVTGDLRSLADCQRAVEGAEAVIHLAAYSEPATGAFEDNVSGTYHLLEAARQAGVRRFLFASTNCVYGQCFRVTQRPFPIDFLPISESHPCRPEDNYGLSKVLCEQLLAQFNLTWGLETAAFRLNWVWGPKEIEWRHTQTATDMVGQAPYLWAYVDARDTARAFRLALEAPSLPPHGAYNLTAADHMADEASADLLAQYYPGVPLRRDLPGRAAFFDGEAARNAFGFEAEHSWRDGWNA
jgi:nucleoside-diphosphate-sugar epimerase